MITKRGRSQGTVTPTSTAADGRLQQSCLSTCLGIYKCRHKSILIHETTHCITLFHGNRCQFRSQELVLGILV